jgi:hypothetical protein
VEERGTTDTLNIGHVIKQNIREKYGEVEVWVHAASTLEKDGIQWLIHVLAALHLSNNAYHIYSKA